MLHGDDFTQIIFCLVFGLMLLFLSVYFLSIVIKYKFGNDSIRLNGTVIGHAYTIRVNVPIVQFSINGLVYNLPAYVSYYHPKDGEKVDIYCNLEKDSEHVLIDEGFLSYIPSIFCFLIGSVLLIIGSYMCSVEFSFLK